jgi:c-di-GMP-binding flagellar brake protein YcgR
LIKDTLIALVRAGDDALAAVQSGPPADVRVVHAPGVVVDWPQGVVVGVRNGSLDRVYVGVDPQLAATAGDRFDALCDVFARAIALRSPTARTMAVWRRPKVNAPRPALDGPRCFSLRFRDRRGELYVATEVFSRGVYETVRASGYEEEVARRYLPPDVASCRTLDREMEVGYALALAGRLELDLSVEAGGEGADRLACRGVLLARHREQDGGGVVLSLDADEDAWRQLSPARMVDVCFGLRGRVFHWRSRVVRHGTVNLVRDAVLPAVTLATPRAIEIRQRRREFRIALPASVNCRVRMPSSEAPTEDSLGFQVLEMPADGAAVEVLDLSFSGAGLLGGEGLPAAFPVGALLEFWIVLPGGGGPLRLGAVVRQASVILTGRNQRQGRLGVEFQPCDEAERRARGAIEHHVMSAERQLAFQRAVAAESQVV